MLFGIRSQLTIIVIMYRFNLRVSMCIYTHECTYVHTRKFDNHKSDKIIYHNEEGGNKCCCHPNI